MLQIYHKAQKNAKRKIKKHQFQSFFSPTFSLLSKTLATNDLTYNIVLPVIKNACFFTKDVQIVTINVHTVIVRLFKCDLLCSVKSDQL